jgi:hypothetical protein
MRHDHEVRIDVTEAASFSQGETKAIVHALEKNLDQDGVSTVRLDGPVLDSPLRHRLTPLIRHLVRVVDRRELRLHFGPV